MPRNQSNSYQSLLLIPTSVLKNRLTSYATKMELIKKVLNERAIKKLQKARSEKEAMIDNILQEQEQVNHFVSQTLSQTLGN